MELKEVIKFYIPVRVYVFSDESITDGFLDKYKKDYPEGVYNPEMNFENMNRMLRDGYPPILRKLDSMTKEEKKEIFKIIFKREFPESGKIIWYANKTRTNDPRWCLWSGVDRAVIEMDGTVWADCDLQYYKFNSHSMTAYLLSKHFDLFNLIESGQAIDATTLKQNV